MSTGSLPVIDVARIKVGSVASRTMAQCRARVVNRMPMLTVACLLLTLSTSAQDNIPTFKTETRSSLVWDEAVLNDDAISTIRDPLTGNEIHKLSYGGIEVSSRLGYERVSPETAGKLLNYMTTIANNTDADVSVRYGGASVDGRIASPLPVAPTTSGLSKNERKDLWDVGKMHCFRTNFASSDQFFSATQSGQTFTVHAKSAATISFVTLDPRNYSALCSIDGCHLKGTVRYYITVDRRDFVFVWPGRSIIDCE